MPVALKYFSQPAILQQIGHRRLAKFLHGFGQDLKAAHVILPIPGAKNDNDFSALAAALALTQRLPESLRKALLTLEAAAAPENHARLHSAIKRRIPNVAVPHDCPLDCALELWFTFPDELSQFTPSAPPRTAAVPAAAHPPPLQDSTTPSLQPAPDSTIQPLNDSTTQRLTPYRNDWKVRGSKLRCR